MATVTSIEGNTFRQIVRISLTVATVAFMLHVPWEFTHSLLYQCFPDGVPFSKAAYLSMHFRAAFGDAGLTLLLLWAGMVVFQSLGWWEDLTRGRIAFLVLGGALIAIAVEYHAVFLAHRWVYDSIMPTVFGIGISPVMQMAILPLLTIVIGRRFLQSSRVY